MTFARTCPGCALAAEPQSSATAGTAVIEPKVGVAKPERWNGQRPRRLDVVTALKAVCVKSWNQDVKREPASRLMRPIELKKSVMLPVGRSTHVGQHRFGWDAGDLKRSDSATE